MTGKFFFDIFSGGQSPWTKCEKWPILEKFPFITRK
jgi:hypothetical protein